MKRLSIILVFVFVAFFTSCKDKKDVVIFGETEWYKPWLGSEYEPIIMERYLEFEFNDDAKALLKDQTFKFELRTIEDTPVHNVILYVDDVRCEDNIFAITTRDAEVKIGIEFKNDAAEGRHDYIIKPLNSANSDMNLDVISFESFGYEDSIQVRKIDVANPVKVLTITLIVIFFAICFLWYVVSRLFIWRSTSFSKIYIDYNDNMGPKCIKMSGKYELVCTNNYKAKDALFAKIFKGSKQYEKNEFWSHDVIITSGGGRNKIRVQGLKDFEVVGETIRKERFEIVNDKGNKVTIETT